eukprot:7214909-Pyramimonas_sp.AAC.1
MDFALRQAANGGWTLSRQAVRRRLNKAADRVATLGEFWADALRAAGHRAVYILVAWAAHPPPPSH